MYELGYWVLSMYEDLFVIVQEVSIVRMYQHCCMQYHTATINVPCIIHILHADFYIY